MFRKSTTPSRRWMSLHLVGRGEWEWAYSNLHPKSAQSFIQWGNDLHEPSLQVCTIPCTMMTPRSYDLRKSPIPLVQGLLYISSEGLRKSPSTLPSSFGLNVCVSTLPPPHRPSPSSPTPIWEEMVLPLRRLFAVVTVSLWYSLSHAVFHIQHKLLQEYSDANYEKVVESFRFTMLRKMNSS